MSVKLRPARAKKGQLPGWEYDIRFAWPDGTLFRERKNSPVPSKSGSLKYAQAREASLLAAGKAALEPPPAPVKAAPTLADFWPRFVRDHYQAERKKPSTIEAAETVYRIHLRDRFGARPLDQIVNADVAALKGELSKFKPKTVNNVLAVLSRALRAAAEWGVIGTMPCKITLLSAPSRSLVWYEVHDYRRLVDGARKAGSGHLCLVLLAGSAGLRRGEIIALKWSDLDLARRQIHVQRAVWHGHEGTPKGGRGRMVPMTPELAAALKAHQHLRGERVLYTEAGEQMKDGSIRHWISVAQRRAGLEVTGAVHMLRHTFCSHLAAAGAPAKAIQDLAGHADLATTQRYMHLSPADRDGAMKVLAGYYSTPARAEEKTG